MKKKKVEKEINNFIIDYKNEDWWDNKTGTFKKEIYWDKKTGTFKNKQTYEKEENRKED